MATNATAHHHDHDHSHDDHHNPTGWRRYLYSTNHKDIGTMYLVYSLIFGLIGGLMSIALRAELQAPGMQVFGDGNLANGAAR